MQRKKWSQMSRPQQIGVVVLGAVELALTAAAAVDLYRRPADQINGPKLAWAGALVIQPVGPLAYLALAPKR